MKKFGLAVSLFSLVMTTSAPVMALESDSRVVMPQVLTKKGDLRVAFANLTTGLTQDNMQARIDQFSNALVASKATPADVINFATLDMDPAARANFESNLNLVMSSELSNADELGAVLGQVVASQATGAHYRSCGNVGDVFAGVAMISGISGFLTTVIGGAMWSGQNEELKALRADHDKKLDDIKAIQSTGIPASNFFVVVKQNEADELQRKMNEKQGEIDTSKMVTVVGAGLLGTAAISTIVSVSCN